MVKYGLRVKLFSSCLLGSMLLTAGCGGQRIITATFAPPARPSAAPTVAKTLPAITAVNLDRTEVPRYESIEMKLTVKAKYSHPYDAREVSLEGVFTGPDGTSLRVPGFWDGRSNWRVRFTPAQTGEWGYQLVLTDQNGVSQPAEGKFTVTDSDRHGWLQVGAQVDPDYSSHYLAYHDGTPFYGVGHCDAMGMLSDGVTVEQGLALFDRMNQAGENYVVWWPLYTMSPINNSYADYTLSNLTMMDMVVKDAQKKGIFLVFTIWDHNELRTPEHAWGPGRWEDNGFNRLGDLSSFFTSAEAWVWQTNFYRYVIARWGYSPAIGMWQTVSEINGTNAYDQTDPWHEKVNAYFVENDPYRHPTTASMSGDVDWERGHQAMDVPQVHLYALEDDAVKTARVVADWTGLMWSREKPNWVGEFGAAGNVYYPEMFHNAIWAGLAAGAALTPAEWNDRGQWGQLTPEMSADISRLAQFVADIPFVQLQPVPLTLALGDPQVRGWGVAGQTGGLLWVQDFSMEGASIKEVRAAKTVRQGVQVEIQGLAAGTYTLRPYDTWQGTYLESLTVECVADRVCEVTLPDFVADLAVKLERP